jgi:hypothetical protein
VIHRRVIVLPARRPAPEPAAAPPPEPMAVSATAPAGPTPDDERRRLDALVGSLRDAVARLDHRRAADADDLRRAALELGTAIAGHLLHVNLQAGNFAVEAVVRKLVGRLPAAAGVTVRLHPDDLVLLRQRLADHGRAGEPPDVEYVADASLARGACRADAGELSAWTDLGREVEVLRDLLAETIVTTRSA